MNRRLITMSSQYQPYTADNLTKRIIGWYYFTLPANRADTNVSLVIDSANVVNLYACFDDAEE